MGAFDKGTSGYSPASNCLCKLSSTQLSCLPNKFDTLQMPTGVVSTDEFGMVKEIGYPWTRFDLCRPRHGLHGYRLVVLLLLFLLFYFFFDFFDFSGCFSGFFFGFSGFFSILGFCRSRRAVVRWNICAMGTCGLSNGDGLG